MGVNRYTVGTVAAAAALVVGGGTALAGKNDGDRVSACQARLAKMAERRGVTVAELTANAKARLLARVDAALAAGRITSEQAAALRARIADAQPCSGPFRRVIRHHVRRRLLNIAAGYLGVTPRELRHELPGTSLAALAAAKGKSVQGLAEALLAPAKSRLEKAVAAGTMSQSQADTRLAALEQHVHRLVERTFPSRS